VAIHGACGERVEPRFAHSSEEHFANLLDFYGVEWHYEPRTFPIAWDARGNPLESFTPDFYLPQFDLYVELTVLRASLQSRKNRKVRLLREAYPGVTIKLFTRRDIERLFSNRLAQVS